jgi:transcriptional regulator with XRE-family HTH domain
LYEVIKPSMDRRRTVETFRERLTQVIERSGLSRSGFAAKVGLDRSTLSQLLSGANDRLPRAETIAAIAEQEQVSTDWLLGMVQEEKIGTNILSEAPEIARGASSYSDERLAAIPAAAFAHTKAQLRRPELDHLERHAAAANAEVLALWSSEPVRSAVRAYVERTLKR